MNNKPPRWLGLLALALGVTVQPLNSTMIVIALPRIATALQIDPALGAWLITAYLLATVITQPALGKLGDRLGHRRLFLLGQVGFALSSLAATGAPNFPLLLACRIGQAVSGAALVPNGAAMLRGLYAAHERGRAFGVYSAVLSLTAATGPVIAGYVVSLADWQAIFYFSAPINTLSFLLTLYTIPPRAHTTAPQRPFDLWGAVTLGAMLLGLMVTLQQASRLGASFELMALALVTSGFAVLFVIQERRHPEPVVNLAFFRNLRFTAAVTSIFFQNLVTYSTFVLMPLFLQSIQKRSASEAGWVIAAQAITGAVVTPLGGTLSDQWGRRLPVVIGTLILLISVSAQIVLQIETSFVWIAGSLMLMGLAAGLSGAAMQTAALEAVAPEFAGVAAGLYSTMRYLGSTLGSVLIGVALAGETNSVMGFDRAFTWLTIAACGAEVVAWGLPTRGKRGDGEMKEREKE
jgi:DHA2 family methylenomycin A resistance protein-like MFS transporter